ncbi:MAG: YdiU family protein [Saprospiraceae bacterium]|nr:YdiU family protein [Saprospiraceae bacterium]
MTDYTLRYFYPDLRAPSKGNLHRLFKESVKRDNGDDSSLAGRVSLYRVMNTDNMSILGLTIDYGPYG